MNRNILAMMGLSPLPSGTVEGISRGAFNDVEMACNAWLEKRGIRYETLTQMNWVQKRRVANQKKAAERRGLK